jgi:hypothetical protein
MDWQHDYGFFLRLPEDKLFDWPQDKFFDSLWTSSN